MHDHNYETREDEKRLTEPVKKGVDTGKAMAKQAAKTATKAVAKLAAKGIAALVGLLGWPAIIIGFIILIVVIFFASFFSAMPGAGVLVGVDVDERDAIIKSYAEERTDFWNVNETWLVSREGRWYPGTGDTGVELNRLVDRFGRDTSLKNEWGDLYAPVLYEATQCGDENKMEYEEYVKTKLESAGESLRPFFYYKESSVTYCNSEGECSTSDVFLLVEAFTIRGHYLYSHEWVTISYDDGSSVTFERPSGTEKLSDGLQYVSDYIIPAWNIPNETPEEKENAMLETRLTFEMGKGYSAQAENLTWLMMQGSLSSFISGASIPAEFRGYLDEASQMTGIPVWLLAAIIERESSWDPNIENDGTGCFGLMQLNSEYWSAWAQRYGYDESDKWDPRVQILVGAQVLKEYAKDFDWANLKPDREFPDDVKAALARYGGYGTDVQKAEGYIISILELSKKYSRPATWPVPGYNEISSHYGMRFHPLLKIWRAHTGTDIKAPEGSKAVSVSAGVVFSTSLGGDWGNVVYIRDTQYEYQYAHLSRIDVKAGDVVNPGDQIGLVGSTGLSTGPHLHFGMRPIGGEWIDPLPMLSGL